MILYRFISIISDPAMHFFVAFSAGAFLYSLTSTISCVLLMIAGRIGLRVSQTHVAIGIVLIPLLLSVSLAFLSHYWLDYWRTWFTTPLGPTIN